MKKSITILDAMDDPRLFGPWFRGKSWGAWRAFLAALFGLQMSDPEAAVFRTHTGRQTVPAVAFREAWLCCGRRAGKSLIAAFIAVYLAFFRDYTPHLAPGEVATVMIVAADRKQARVILRYVRGFVREIPMLSKMLSRELKESVEFTNRVVIEVHTASYRTIRGYTCAGCINDEISFWVGDEESAEPAGEIIAAERPALATLPGALLLSLSSPHARRGPLWESFKTYHGQDNASVLFWKASSQAMNSKLDASIVAEAYERDPVAAAAEYGAEFRSDCDSYVSREVVEACLYKGTTEIPRVEGVRYFGFVDPSGGSADSMTLGIAHRTAAARVVLDLLREVKPPFSPEKVTRDFAAILTGYGIAEVTGDRYAGEWPRERFRASGITYKPSERSRSEIYVELLPLLNSRRSVLLDNPRLVAQLTGLERHAARTGAEIVDHAPGGHDDLANSAAGALVLAEASHGSANAGFGSLTANPYNPLLRSRPARLPTGKTTAFLDAKAPSLEELRTISENARDVKNVESLLLALSGDMQLRESRIRKAGSWCFFCADDHSLARCGCSMPESLGCHGKRVCSDCANAHRAIAGHLRKMFKAPIVDCSSSVRAKLFSQLHGAADELAEKNGVPLEGSLHLHLADACPFDDERGEFKGKVLHAFERSQFTDFQGLAKELARETDEELKLKVARWFSCIR